MATLQREETDDHAPAPALGFRSLQAKFLLFVVPLVLLAILLVFGIFEYKTHRTEADELRTKLDQVLRIQSAVLSAPVWNLADEQIELIVTALLVDPEVLEVAVFDEKGGLILAESKREEGQVAAYYGRSEITFVDGDQSEVIGSLALHLTDQLLVQRRQTRWILAVSLAATLLLAVVASVIIAHHRTLGIPLRRLLTSIRRSQAGEEAVHVDWKSGDEMGRVISAFNRMLSEQMSYARELRAARDGLEERVKLSDRGAGGGEPAADRGDREHLRRLLALRQRGPSAALQQHLPGHHAPGYRCPDPAGCYLRDHLAGRRGVGADRGRQGPGGGLGRGAPRAAADAPRIGPAAARRRQVGAHHRAQDRRRRHGGDLHRRDRAAGGQGGGGGGQRGQEHLPCHHEPRDSHADERHHRHEQPAARHQAERRAAIEFSQTIGRSAEELLTVINDILDFSRVEAGKLELDTRAFMLRTCVEEALDLVAVLAAKKNLELAYQIEPGTPSTPDRRCDASAPDPDQPPQQRGQVHRPGRGGLEHQGRDRDGEDGRVVCSR